jgi:hypothetical protein
MAELSAKICVSNDRQREWTLLVEPWGTPFTLLPGRSLDIVALGEGEMPWFNVVEEEALTLIWCKHASDFAVYSEGRRIE